MKSPKLPDYLDLNLPTPDTPLKKHAPKAIGWEAYMRETAERARLFFENPANHNLPHRSPVEEPFIMHDDLKFS